MVARMSRTFVAAGLLFILAQQNLWSDAPKTVTIGNGSGYLDYPKAQETLKLRPGDTLYITAGTYKGISLGNLSGTIKAPITVKCDPKTVFTTTAYVENFFTNLAFLHFQDFRFETYPYRCITINGASHDLVFKNCRAKNASDYVFYIHENARRFDGTKSSTFYNFKWEGCVFDATGPAIITGGGWVDLQDVSLDFEISRCIFQNCENSPVQVNKCFDLRVHDSLFADNGGRSFRAHMANIVGSGYFQVYNNTFLRNWANDVRVMPLRLNALGYNGPDAINRFYNNISSDKKKYAMFEVNEVNVPQATMDEAKGYFSRTGSEIYFNTLYRSRKVDYVAPLVDVYASQITIAHNLVIEPECDAPFDSKRDYILSWGSGERPGVVATNNLVFPTLAASGLVDAVKFVPSAASPVKDAAKGRVPYITRDHYGNTRYEGAADVGAVERPKKAALP